MGPARTQSTFINNVSSYGLFLASTYLGTEGVLFESRGTYKECFATLAQSHKAQGHLWTTLY